MPLSEEEQARIRSKLELAKLKHEIELEKREELHAERIRVYGIQKATEMQRQDTIRRIQNGR